MFKWPGAPSARPREYELADYMELICWRDKVMSATSLSKLLGRLDENDYSDGVPEEEEASQIVEDAYCEIERRCEACRGGYPFVIGNKGYTLHASKCVGNRKHVIYKYMLLATRLNMKSNRCHAGMNGAFLFEKLAAEAAREYFGARAESLVFGTASDARFCEKVNDLCRRIREGDGFENCDEAAPTAQDGKLDVVVWKHFTDGRPGKLIAFGQCKTGTNYRDTLTQLQPDSFCKKWLRSSPVLNPIRMFFVSDALSRSHWRSKSVDAGLLFDRCRIVDFCDDINEDVLTKVATWTAAAAEATGLPGTDN